MQANTDNLIKKAFPVEKSPETVTIRLQDCVRQRTPLAIACSGGADSVFLVRWFLTHFPEARDQIALLHFNHRMRGEESDVDEAFVVDLGKKLGLPVICGNRTQEDSHNNSEAGLRKARLAFIRKTMAENHIKTLLTGHHAGDRVEMLLMRLSRGSTLDALLAPAPVQIFRNGTVHLRPLLDFDKETIVNTLRSIGQDWREDSSNQNTDYYRNFIRNELLPAWEKACPQKLDENIRRTCSLLQDDADALNKWAASTVESIELNATSFPSSQLKMLPAAIQRRCLWMWFNHHGISENLSFDLIERLLHAVPGQSFNLSDSGRISVNDRGDLMLETLAATEVRPFAGGFRLSEGSTLFFPDGTCLHIETIPATNELIGQICAGQDDPETQIHLDFEACKVSSGVRIGFWQEGMQYRPLGLGHHRKLQDCFTDRKVSANKRRRLPVIINEEDEILWVPGLLPAEIGRVTQGSNSLLRLTCFRS